VVSGPAEAEKLPSLDKVNIVAQTTQEEDIFKQTAEIIRQKSKEAVISDTICQPTKDRQRETIKFARDSDLVIVVGGKHSANTQRLYQICARLSPKVLLAETDEEINETALNGAKKIFITAGASTPNWMIEKIVKKTRKLTRKSESFFTQKLAYIWNVIITSSLFTAISAMCLTYICMKFQNFLVDLKFVLLSGLFVGSLHLFNRIEEKGANIPDEVQTMLFAKHKKTAKLAAVVAGTVSILISLSFSFYAFLLTAAFWLAGTFYPYKALKFSKFLNFPASKDIVTSLGWAFVCAGIPAISNNALSYKSTHLAILFAILIVFIRSTLMGISNVHNDMMIGKENFYKAAGPRPTYIIIFLTFIFIETLFVSLMQIGYNKEIIRRVSYSLAYYLGLLLIFIFGKIPRRVLSETAIDFQFLLSWSLLVTL